MKPLVLLGATGSIGQSVLRLLHDHPEAPYPILALSAHTNDTAMHDLCRRWTPQHAVMVCPQAAQRLRASLKDASCTTQVHEGPEALKVLAALPEAHTVVCAIVGLAGLPSLWSAVAHHKHILLANKEAFVVGGSLFKEHLKQHPATRLVPLDSEHNAIYQALGEQYVMGTTPEHVRDITLTASGGPFKNHTAQQLQNVTRAHALQHPTWSMGAKITVDSSTLMNKGFEVIEAHGLFNLPLEQIQVVVHPESIVHGWVRFSDGSLLAHMGPHDMRVPISHGLSGFKRWNNPDLCQALDLAQMAQLHFEAPDRTRFPCLRLAEEALQTGAWALVALNAANEIAVEAFLKEQIRWCHIPHIIAQVLEKTPTPILSLETLMDADQQCRMHAQQAIHRSVDK